MLRTLIIKMKLILLLRSQELQGAHLVLHQAGLSINASTGTIDLENSTIQAYTITYTVSGVSANFSLSVTASPFIANDFSMQFNGVDNYILQPYNWL